MSSKPWHLQSVKERWAWYSGPWRERDACGAWCSREAIESGESETLCRNGGSYMGPGSKFFRESRSRIRDEWRVAQHAAYLNAENATNGYMVKKGAPADVTPSSFYPAAAGHRPPIRWASEELQEYWNGGGQRPISLREFQHGWQTQFQHPLD
jgi:hypothetical protein